MGRIDQETVNKILDTADIVEVVSDFVKLRRSGANYKGLCPFHNERTPSFSVNKARNICKCFSCGKGGSPVNFIMEHEQMTYVEALRWLARKYNIEVVEHDVSEADKEAASARESMFAVNEFALKHFEHNLTETAEGQSIALSYFRKRGINDAMVKRFHLGYSVEKSNDLYNTAREKGFSEQSLVDTGLCVRSDRGDCYDRFRTRVIFPIHTVSGRTVGFGGRTMRGDKQVAKYVNSPESIIYSKKKEIYGLYQAKSAIAKKDKAIMVEGYMDVISMHQAGVENVVASSGTSLTQEQIRALMRFTRNITVIYDSDAAGIKASLRGISLILAEGLNVKALLLPEGDDPDSFARSHSSTEVEEYLKTHEQDIIAFMTDILMRDVAPNDPTARAKVINTILQTVAMVDDQITRMSYVAQCARTFGMSEDVIALQLKKFVATRLETIEREAARARAQESIRPLMEEETKQGGSDSTPDPAVVEAAAKAVVSSGGLPADKSLLPYEKMILRYAVRYGLLEVATSATDGSMGALSVAGLIVSELGRAGLEFTDTTVKRTFEKIVEIANGEAFPLEHEEEYQRLLAVREAAYIEGVEKIRLSAENVSEIEKAETALTAKLDGDLWDSLDQFDMEYLQRQLCSSPDDAIRLLATDLACEKYTLSKIHTKYAQLETEQEQLTMLVPRAVHEYHAAVLSKELARLQGRLRDAVAGDSSEKMEDLLVEIASMQKLHNELARSNGERIILPKNR
ncbi:MAG: DNA primase [Muribaculaceae bacterium]|nr:DNA primase [Muribaculaceae bacterium]